MKIGEKDLFDRIAKVKHNKENNKKYQEWL